MPTVRNLWNLICFQPDNQKSTHSDTMHLLYDQSPASVLKRNAILRTDVINDLSPTASFAPSFLLEPGLPWTVVHALAARCAVF